MSVKVTKYLYKGWLVETGEVRPGSYMHNMGCDTVIHQGNDNYEYFKSEQFARDAIDRYEAVE